MCSVVDDVRIYDEALSPERIAALAEGGPPVQTFVRGDADANGAMNITDGIYLLNFLFLGGPGASHPSALTRTGRMTS